MRHRTHRSKNVAETSGAPETDQPAASQSSFLFEKHLEDFLVKNWRNLPIGNQYDIYEEDGERIGQQFRTGTGPIDILGLNKDKSDFLVLELKRDRASDVVVGQTLRYMGWVQEHLCSPAQSVNGCIIAHAQDERLQYALNQVPNIRFMKYEVDFRLVGLFRGRLCQANYKKGKYRDMQFGGQSRMGA